jgi:hypothetical protein
MPLCYLTFCIKAGELPGLVFHFSRNPAFDSNLQLGIGGSALQFATISGYGLKDLRARHSSAVISHVSEGWGPET